MERVRVVLENYAGQPIHVSELAADVGACERTLRYAFNAYYQVNPRAYLQLRQLHNVRKDLLAADPSECSVTSILTRWGIWELRAPGTSSQRRASRRRCGRVSRIKKSRNSRLFSSRT